MRETLLVEGVLTKFLRYVQIDSTSNEKGEGVPSTPGQWNLAHMLAQELIDIGLESVNVDENAIVTGFLPGNDSAPIVGLIAHMDTSPAVSGTNVKPIVHSEFSGYIGLPDGGVLNAETDPVLQKVVGHTLVTSQGSTLLGVDDKAGIAEIMEALCTLIRDPKLPRSPLWVAFTPDEEIGRGIAKLNLARFPANVAYTLDGGELGEMHGENFNALNIKLHFQGKSAHTGSARGLMTNALAMAAFFISAIPIHMRPETTSGREGFIHVDELVGNVESAEAEVLLRDFSAAGLQAKKDMIATCCRLIEQAFPHGSVTSEEIRGYRNMNETLKKDPRIIEFLEQAISESNIDPLIRAIRGGTDGAELSAQGLPTPNLFVGGGGFHSRTEWASVQWMGKAVEVAVRLIGLWGTTAQTSRP